MRTTVLSLLTVAAAVSLSAETSSPKLQGFATASVAYGFLGDFDNAAGYQANVGLTYQEKHSIEVEVASFNTGDDLLNDDNFKFMPVLIGYRYNQPLAKNLDVFVGALGGVMRQEVDVWWYKATDTVGTFGVKAGLDYAFNEHFSAVLGYTLLRVSESDFVTDGNMSYLSFGLGFKF